MTSRILQTSMRLIVPLSLLFAAYMTLKGHNEPGGGFIGGLIAAVTLAMFRMSDGPEALRRFVPVHPRTLILTGLTLALLTALVPMLFGQRMLTSSLFDIHIASLPTLHVASAMFFDIGVLLVVVGVSIGMIVRLSEELET